MNTRQKQAVAAGSIVGSIGIAYLLTRKAKAAPNIVQPSDPDFIIGFDGNLDGADYNMVNVIWKNAAGELEIMPRPDVIRPTTWDDVLCYFNMGTSWQCRMNCINRVPSGLHAGACHYYSDPMYTNPVWCDLYPHPCGAYQRNPTLPSGTLTKVQKSRLLQQMNHTWDPETMIPLWFSNGWGLFYKNQADDVMWLVKPGYYNTTSVHDLLSTLYAVCNDITYNQYLARLKVGAPYISGGGSSMDKSKINFAVGGDDGADVQRGYRVYFYDRTTRNISKFVDGDPKYVDMIVIDALLQGRICEDQAKFLHNTTLSPKYNNMDILPATSIHYDMIYLDKTIGQYSFYLGQLAHMEQKAESLYSEGRITKDQFNTAIAQIMGYGGIT